MGHACTGNACGGRPSVEALETGCAAPVCGGSQGVPSQCRIVIAFCFFGAGWEVYCMVVVVQDRGSWGLR